VFCCCHSDVHKIALSICSGFILGIVFILAIAIAIAIAASVYIVIASDAVRCG